MRFLRQRESSVSFSIVITPLVDLLMVFLFFFMVSATFERGEKRLGLELPRTEGRDSRPAGEAWLLSIQRDGAIYCEGSRLDLATLAARLDSGQPRAEKISVTIRADSRVPYGMVAQVLGLCSQKGYRRVSFMTLEAASPKP